jgi:hypothetical protein
MTAWLFSRNEGIARKTFIFFAGNEGVLAGN